MMSRQANSRRPSAPQLLVSADGSSHSRHEYGPNSTDSSGSARKGKVGHDAPGAAYSSGIDTQNGSSGGGTSPGVSISYIRSQMAAMNAGGAVSSPGGISPSLDQIRGAQGQESSNDSSASKLNGTSQSVDVSLQEMLKSSATPIARGGRTNTVGADGPQHASKLMQTAQEDALSFGQTRPSATAQPTSNSSHMAAMSINGPARVPTSGLGGTERSSRFVMKPSSGSAAIPPATQRIPSSRGPGSLPQPSAGPYPSTSTMMARGDTGSNTSASTLVGSSQGGMGSESGSFRDAWFRRLCALMYLKQSLAGISQSSTAGHSAGLQPWLDSTKLTKRDMAMHDDPERMHKRTARKYMLGCSLAPTLEVPSATECARTVLLVLTEVDALPDGGEKDKARMRNFFKSSTRGRRPGGTDLSNSLDGVGVGGPSSLATSSSGVEFIGAHVPFRLDFWQVIQTLCDVLVEIYCKLGMALQQPGGSAWAHDEGMGGQSEGQASLAGLTESMQKIDVRVKKLFSQLIKEIDLHARKIVREELAAVDPSLARELGVLDESIGGSVNSNVGGGTASKLTGGSLASATGAHTNRGQYGSLGESSV